MWVKNETIFPTLAVTLQKARVQRFLCFNDFIGALARNISCIMWLLSQTQNPTPLTLVPGDVPCSCITVGDWFYIKVRKIISSELRACWLQNSHFSTTFFFIIVSIWEHYYQFFLKNLRRSLPKWFEIKKAQLEKSNCFEKVTKN